MHTVLPPGALGSYTPGAHPMISEGRFRAILLGTGRFPPRCAYLEYTSTAGEVGTMTCKWPPRTLIVPPALDECIGNTTAKPAGWPLKQELQNTTTKSARQWMRISHTVNIFTYIHTYIHMIRHKSIYVHTLILYKRYKQIRSHIIKQYNHTYSLTFIHKGIYTNIHTCS